MDVIIHFDEIYLKGNNQAFFTISLLKIYKLFLRARAKKNRGRVMVGGAKRTGFVPAGFNSRHRHFCPG